MEKRHAQILQRYSEEEQTAIKEELVLVENDLQQGNYHQALLSAVKADFYWCASFLLDFGVDPNFASEDDCSPLYLAVTKKNIPMLTLLIEKGADLHMHVYKESLLYWAMRCRSEAIALLLLDKGADPLQPTSCWSPSLFHYACTRGYVCVVEKMLELGVMSPKKEEQNPLHSPLLSAFESIENTYQLCVLLVQHGVDVNQEEEQGVTPLSEAFRVADEATILYLINNGARLSDNLTTSLMHQVVERGKCSLVKLLIEQNYAFDNQNHIGQTPLFTACEKNHLHIAKLLLDKSAEVNARDLFDNTPLFFVEAPDMGQLLIDYDADVHCLNSDCMTFLHRAAKKGNLYMMKVALDQGVNLNLADSKGNTPLHYAAGEWHGPGAAALLLDFGADVDAINHANQSVLDLAKHPAIISLLLDRGAQIFSNLHTLIWKPECLRSLTHQDEVDQRDDFGKTPLIRAAEFDLLESAQLLIKAGGDVNAQDDQGQTPLMMTRSCQFADLLIVSGARFSLLNHRQEFSSLSRDPEMLRFVIEKGKDIKTTDRFNRSLLHIHSDPALLTYLIDKGVDLEQEDDQGCTPLHTHYDSYASAELLLEKGANINHVDHYGRTPLHKIAACMGPESHKIMGLFLKHGAQLDVRDHDGNTPLHRAATHFIENVICLIEHGASIDPINQASHTPLHLAIQMGYQETVSTLLKAGASTSILTLEALNAYEWAAKCHGVDIADSMFKRDLHSKEEGIKFKQALVERLKPMKMYEKLTGEMQKLWLEGFMDGIGSLFLDYFQFHLEETHDCAADYQAQLIDLEKPIEWNYIDEEVSYQEYFLSCTYEDGLHWPRICRVRTNIEAFHQMFGGYVTLNVEEVDELIDAHQSMADLRGEAIPDQMPQSHWWWFTAWRYS